MVQQIASVCCSSTGGTQVEYYYDYEAPNTYQSNNNRLMKAETYVADGGALLSTDYY